MRDILIPKDLESSVEQTEISFNTISVGSMDKKSHACCIVSPKSVNFDESEESTVILSSDIEFSSKEDDAVEEVIVFVPISEEECNCRHEEAHQPSISDIIDFESVLDIDDTDQEIIIPENVIFNGPSGTELEHIVHHIKVEHRDYYKGTSFRWIGAWEPNKLYSRDDYFVDFIHYNGALWVCLESHFGTDFPDKTPQYWHKIIEGVPGQDGVDGKDGYTPQIGVDKHADGLEYWTVDGEWLLDSFGNKVKSVGVDGKDGYTPQIGVRKDIDNILYWTIDGIWLLDADSRKVKAVGIDGRDGIDGQDGITPPPQLKIENDYWYISYDDGKTWTQLGKAKGEDGKDGIDGTNGINGTDGVDGYTPQIGVAKDANDVYYWTLDGEWLLDTSGNKIKATGTDGKDGRGTIHVGPTPPTKEEYGDDFENVLWVYTTDSSQNITQVYAKVEIDKIVNTLKEELGETVLDNSQIDNILQALEYSTTWLEYE